MRDLIQALGDIQRLYVSSIGGPCEAGYRFQVQRGVRKLSTDTNFFKALGFLVSEFDRQDIAENAMLLGISLLYIYRKYRDKAEQKEAEVNEENFDFDELENIYYAASAFICTAQDWKKASILS